MIGGELGCMGKESGEPSNAPEATTARKRTIHTQMTPIDRRQDGSAGFSKKIPTQ